jgi:hypothetical protein
MNNLEKLTKKIKELVPEIGTRNTSVIIPEPFSGIINYRNNDITLEDVLIALEINKGCDVLIDCYGEFANDLKQGTIHWEDKYWQLGKPLNEQAPETIEWLNNIIK